MTGFKPQNQSRSWEEITNANLWVFNPYNGAILLVIALIIFGPGRLPELGRSLGKGIKEFKSATTIEDTKKVTEE